MTTLAIEQVKIATIGPGYVGLPLAVHLSHHSLVTDFDINEEGVAELRNGHPAGCSAIFVKPCRSQTIAHGSGVREFKRRSV